ncbi:MAG: DUF2934 domain-containing protein [Lentisphaerae bacterium]|jgi:hypothetical protein|nr:DUF2934 domain-containing protein [Lentisphaerota bacterium]
MKKETKTTVKKAAPKAAAVKKAAPKKAAPKKAAAAKKLPTAEERYCMIQEAAYFIAERHGFDGDSAYFWSLAEAQINASLE